MLLHIRRNFSTMEWILSVLKTGAAYAVADQSHPLERKRGAMEVAQPTVVVDDGGSADLKKLLEGFSGEVVDSQTMVIDGLPTYNLVDETSDGDLAYVVFTSGSTGWYLFFGDGRVLGLNSFSR